MLDELNTLERLLTEIASGVAITPEQHAAQRAAIQAEAERIRKAFIREAFGLAKERLIEHYIQLHQTALVELIDRLLEYLSPAQLDVLPEERVVINSTDQLRFLYQQLEQLLLYIERHFTKYFNLSAKSPESYRFMVHRELKRRVPELRYALEKKQVNKRLLAIALMPLDTFIESVRTQEISYRRIIYLRGLLAELELLAVNRLTGRRLDYKMCLALGYLNYNTSRFFSYCVREITALVQEQATLSQQIEKLAFFLKVVNQGQVKPGYVYQEKHASLHEQLALWLGEEVVYFEKRQQLSINFPLNANDPVQKEFKLRLNISVAQLACLLRGLKDTGVIRNNNVLEVIRFFAGITQTKNTESISWESLRTKYYNPEQGAREAMKEVGIGLFNYFRG